jgi:hypothetical protein
MGRYLDRLKAAATHSQERTAAPLPALSGSVGFVGGPAACAEKRAAANRSRDQKSPALDITASTPTERRSAGRVRACPAAAEAHAPPDHRLPSQQTSRHGLQNLQNPPSAGSVGFVGGSASGCGNHATDPGALADSGEPGHGDSQPRPACAGEDRVRAWLAQIGEDDPGSIEEVLAKCRADAEARAYYLRRADEIPLPPWQRPEATVDSGLRSCTECRNISDEGFCRAVRRGELRGVRTWQPDPTLSRRCVSYAPGPDNRDQRPGRERWPFLLRYERKQ